MTGSLVTFRQTYVFESTGDVLAADSSLTFRSRTEVERSLSGAGFALREIRDAPDRPGRELVVIAHRDRPPD